MHLPTLFLSISSLSAMAMAGPVLLSIPNASLDAPTTTLDSPAAHAVNPVIPPPEVWAETPVRKIYKVPFDYDAPPKEMCGQGRVRHNKRDKHFDLPFWGKFHAYAAASKSTEPAATATPPPTPVKMFQSQRPLPGN
ncbi:hypothetical protein B0T14DRAFT_501162 [Immersiella caudata]|uniref:Uncharacterized protein n=1 Tax=Immersiella caudata TaxID=314043 RepID=A0AA39U6X0_9PEZI|nr:hypothetical protein B0T14DRAFT_501162 [Immersiella caudata]